MTTQSPAPIQVTVDYACPARINRKSNFICILVFLLLFLNLCIIYFLFLFPFFFHISIYLCLLLPFFLVYTIKKDIFGVNVTTQNSKFTTGGLELCCNFFFRRHCSIIPICSIIPMLQHNFF